MVENNDKGKKARRYFIEKEKELKKLEKSNNDQVSHLRIPDFSNPAEAARDRIYSPECKDHEYKCLEVHNLRYFSI